MELSVNGRKEHLIFNLLTNETNHLLKKKLSDYNNKRILKKLRTIRLIVMLEIAWLFLNIWL